ncbi:MAG: hypothetical protein WC785_07235 [Tatlockia sp.]|jgi:hypothetical protein
MNKAKKPVMFKKQLNPHAKTPEEIREDFDKLLHVKSKGHWLLQESQMPGVITISFKADKAVEHYYYIYFNQKWQKLTDAMREAQVDFEKNISHHGEKLIKQLISHGLDIDKLVLPAVEQNQQSDNHHFSDYTIT